MLGIAVHRHIFQEQERRRMMLHFGLVLVLVICMRKTPVVSRRWQMTRCGHCRYFDAVVDHQDGDCDGDDGSSW